MTNAWLQQHGAVVTAGFTGELGTDNIERARSYAEDALRMTVLSHHEHARITDRLTDRVLADQLVSLIHVRRRIDGLMVAIVRSRSVTARHTPDRTRSDDRLLVIESEFAKTLKTMARKEKTLSATMRQAWASGNLRTLTRHGPLKATGAHVSIIGHITVEDLQKFLDYTDAANGFGNRFLWAVAMRSKLLPEGGALEYDVASRRGQVEGCGQPKSEPARGEMLETAETANAS